MIQHHVPRRFRPFFIAIIDRETGDQIGSAADYSEAYGYFGCNPKTKWEKVHYDR